MRSLVLAALLAMAFAPSTNAAPSPKPHPFFQATPGATSAANLPHGLSGPFVWDTNAQRCHSPTGYVAPSLCAPPHCAKGKALCGNACVSPAQACQQNPAA